MTNKFPQLNIQQFAHNYEVFYESVCSILEEADEKGILWYVITDDINSQYRFSEIKRKGYSLFDFLKKTYLADSKDVFFIFL